MFFTISTEPDCRLPNHDKFGDYWFSHDDGWKKINNCWYKGYNHPQANHGNFLKLNLVSNNNILLEHDTVRGFPLWWDNQTQMLTNLLGTGLEIWNDKIVSIQDHCLRDKNCNSYDFLKSNEMSVDCTVDLLCNNLVAKAHALKTWETDIPKKIFLTGGMDTTTIYSVLKYVGVDVELVDYEYVKYDCFLNENLANIKKNHWGYNQIHHWDKSTLLITGAFGDEFLMRGPSAISLWAAFNDINIVELLTTNCDNYHYSYFLKDKNVKILSSCWNTKADIKQKYQDTNSLNNQIINQVGNDCQHWHLGNTITWTPFKDIEILKTCLNLNVEDLTDHILDATLNKHIIRKMYPKALSLISRHKNTDSRKNLNTLVI